MNMNERAIIAVGNETELSFLVKDYMPFIASYASRVTGRYVSTHDDEMSIAIIAFSEAIRRYEPNNSNFLRFAASVIRSRLIDYMRSKNRDPQKISLDSLAERDEDDKSESVLEEASLAQAPQIWFDDPLKLDIDALSGVLKLYGFCFMDVAECSPKSEKTKKACKAAARSLSADRDLMKRMKKTKQLPLHELGKISGVPRKTMERHRNYIVCLAEILSGDYEALSGFIGAERGGGGQ